MTEFIAVRCARATCGQFSSQQVTKSGKWQCKLCSERQSIVRIYARSLKASDVRGAVQELNMRRGAMEERRMEDRYQAAQAGWDDLADGEGSSYGGGGHASASGPVGQQWGVFLVGGGGGDDGAGRSGSSDSVAEPEDPRFVTAMPQREKRRSAPTGVRSSAAGEGYDGGGGGSSSGASISAKRQRTVGGAAAAANRRGEGDRDAPSPWGDRGGGFDNRDDDRRDKASGAFAPHGGATASAGPAIARPSGTCAAIFGSSSFGGGSSGGRAPAGSAARAGNPSLQMGFAAAPLPQRAPPSKPAAPTPPTAAPSAWDEYL